jgi:hypothetical protein
VTVHGIGGTPRDDGERRRGDEETEFLGEEHVRQALARRRGYRSDLRGEGAAEAGDTDEIIARRLGRTRTQVRDRRKVSGSSVSTDALKIAVKTGRVARTGGADLVREAERLVEEGAIEEEARAHVDDALVAGRRRRPRQGTKNGCLPTACAAADEEQADEHDARVLVRLMMGCAHRADHAGDYEEAVRQEKLSQSAAGLLAELEARIAARRAGGPR